MNIEYTYYGRYDRSIKVKEGVHLFMIDEAVKKVIDKRMAEFLTEFKKVVEGYRNEFPEIKRIAADYKSMRKIVKDLNFKHQI